MRTRAAPSGPRRAIKLSEVSRESIQRWPTGLPEFDRALGGGLVPGGVILLGGDPGIGKSTLTLQAVAALAGSRRALYVSGEESAAQVAARGERLGLDLALIEMLAETSLSAILNEIQALQPQLVIIDSIQTLFNEELSSAPGSVVKYANAPLR